MSREARGSFLRDPREAGKNTTCDALRGARLIFERRTYCTNANGSEIPVITLTSFVSVPLTRKDN